MSNLVLNNLAKYPALEELHYRYKGTILPNVMWNDRIGVVSGFSPCEITESIGTQVRNIRRYGFGTGREVEGDWALCNRYRFNEFGVLRKSGLSDLFEEVFNLNQERGVFLASAGDSIFKVTKEEDEYVFVDKYSGSPVNFKDPSNRAALTEFMSTHPPIPAFFIALSFVRV